MKYEMTAIGVERLGNAIVEQAARDYVDLKKELIDLSENYLENTNRVIQVVDELKHLIRFFRSQWYRQLTDVDSEWLMKKLDEKAIEDWHKDQEKKSKKKA